MLRVSLELTEMNIGRVSYSIIFPLLLTWQASLQQTKRLITVNTHHAEKEVMT